MKRLLVYRPAARRELNRMDRGETSRIIRALEVFATDGRGDVKALKDTLKGRYRLRVGKWRIFFRIDRLGMDQSESVVVTEIDNRGQAY